MVIDFSKPLTDDERQWMQGIGSACQILAEARSYILYAVCDDGTMKGIFPVTSKDDNDLISAVLRKTVADSQPRLQEPVSASKPL